MLIEITSPGPHGISFLNQDECIKRGLKSYIESLPMKLFVSL